MIMSCYIFTNRESKSREFPLLYFKNVKLNLGMGDMNSMLPLLLMKDGSLGDNKTLMLMMMQGGNMGAMNPLLMMSLLE